MAIPKWASMIEKEEKEPIADIINRELSYNVPIKDIAKSFSVSDSALRRLIDIINGITPDDKEMKRAEANNKIMLARKDWSKRITVKSLAEKYGVSRSTMNSWLNDSRRRVV